METCCDFLKDENNDIYIFIKKIDNEHFDGEILYALMKLVCLQINILYTMFNNIIEMIHISAKYSSSITIKVMEQSKIIESLHAINTIEIYYIIFLCIFICICIWIDYMNYINSLYKYRENLCKYIYNVYRHWKIKSIKPSFDFLPLLSPDIICKITIDHLSLVDMANFMRCNSKYRNIIYNNCKYKWLLYGYNMSIKNNDVEGIKYLNEIKHIQFKIHDINDYSIKYITHMTMQIFMYLSEHTTFFDTYYNNDFNYIEYDKIHHSEFDEDDDGLLYISHSYSYNIKIANYASFNTLSTQKAIYMMYDSKNTSLYKKYKINSFLFVVLFCNVDMLKYHFQNYHKYKSSESYYIDMSKLIKTACEFEKFDMVTELLKYANANHPGEDMNKISLAFSVNK